MVIRVLFFGVLKEIVGRESESVLVPDGGTVADVLASYRQSFPALERWIPSLAVAVNREYSAPATPLKAGDEVGLLPPVSGGAEAARAEIVRERIDTERLVEAIKRGEDGAVVCFEGVVRNNTRGRRTLYLDYESYEPMALGKLREVAAQAVERFGVRDVVVVHRVGRLEIGETSVAIVVASAHRGAAFDACRWAIDTLKRTVPIWKKEHFEDGAVWADGEPFPENLGAAARQSERAAPEGSAPTAGADVRVEPGEAE